MKLTVIGSSAVCPNPDDASSGYLFEAADKALLVDCGPGVISRLQRYLPYWQLDYVILSHLHSDHLLDLIPLRYGLRYNPKVPPDTPVSLYVPPGGHAHLEALGRLMDPQGKFWDQELAITEYDPQATLGLGPFQVQFVPVHHYVPCWGMRITADGVTIGYSADTGPGDGLQQVAHNVDLFICEATIPTRRGTRDPGHLTPAEAGEIARQAGAQRLLLTHTWQIAARHSYVTQAAKYFDGPVEVAYSGWHVTFESLKR